MHAKHVFIVPLSYTDRELRKRLCGLGQLGMDLQRADWGFEGGGGGSSRWRNCNNKCTVKGMEKARGGRVREDRFDWKGKWEGW